MDKTKDSGIASPEFSQSKCMNCYWIGDILDLEVKDEEISDDAIYFACPRCSSKDILPYENGKVYDLDGKVHE